MDYRLLFDLAGDANGELARYDGLLQGIPNPAVMLPAWTTRQTEWTQKPEPQVAVFPPCSQ